MACSWDFHGVFTEYSYVSVMYRLCVGYVSGMCRVCVGYALKDTGRKRGGATNWLRGVLKLLRAEREKSKLSKPKVH